MVDETPAAGRYRGWGWLRWRRPATPQNFVSMALRRLHPTPAYHVNVTDREYLQIVLDAIRVCARYKPRFGKRTRRDGLTLEQFQKLYRGDAFYSWFGLDDPMMYAAHKAAGGMTSVYRQIGIGCERLFRRVLKDSLELSEDDVTWSYRVTLPSGRQRTLYLDARVPVEKIGDKDKRHRFRWWMTDAAKILDIDQSVFSGLTGSVFEVRQVTRARTRNDRTPTSPMPLRHTPEDIYHAPCYCLDKSTMTSCYDTGPRSGR